MKVNQIYTLLNDVTKEVLGKTDLVNEDLSNVVDIGTAVFEADATDNYVRSLVNHIGKVIFVDRTYKGSVPSVLMDGWEYGSILEKVTAELPEATENDTWNLEDKKSYDPNIFYKPIVTAKFYNKKVTFEIPMSFTEKQVKESFSNAEQLNGFISMLYNSIERSMTIKLDSLIMRCINNMIASTLYSEFPEGDYSGTGKKAINVLNLYNTTHATALTLNEAITDKDFIRYASYIISLYSKRIEKMSTLFNIGGKERFTPDDKKHIVLLTDFSKASTVFLQSDSYNKELVALPNYEEVPYWQGSGQDFSITNNSSIDVIIEGGHNVKTSGIIGVIFDRDALGVANIDRRVTTSYNPKGEFFNNWYKYDAGYFNDTNENFIVFYMA